MKKPQILTFKSIARAKKRRISVQERHARYACAADKVQTMIAAAFTEPERDAWSSALHYVQEAHNAPTAPGARAMLDAAEIYCNVASHYRATFNAYQGAL